MTSPSAPAYVVRKAVASDIPRLHALLAAYAANGEMLPRPLTELYEHLRDFFVAEANGQLIGAAGLQVFWADLGEVRTLVVDSDFRMGGVGRALVNACVGEAAALGIRRIFALTYRADFFKKLGFETVDKASLPHKVWTVCINCSKFPACDEEAVVLQLDAEGRPLGGVSAWHV